ncbi:MAG: response regulator transcription factor [Opitutaceae bacterium]
MLRSNLHSSKGTVGIPPVETGKNLHKALLVEDHPITRAGLRALINSEHDLQVCGEADDGPAAISLVSSLRPSIVVTDIALKSSNGIELIKNLLAISPTIGILAMSMHDERVYAERVLRAGAKGYIMKKEAAERIVPAIRSILGGGIYLSECMREKLLAGIVLNRKKEEVVFPLESLSDREIEVFQLIGNGFSTREIGQRLKLSPKTIDSYREHLKIKLKLKTGAELLRNAIRWSRLENAIDA